ncbi:PREDICTED: arylsulfatase B-like [Papilio xuthus]|uniref:Arylsulfatase B-like n=1 Tax=Papilio xuthus TaxID=66420 RepID=A0AAJ6Z3P8_PAPXU|nr:PREDICTED: arylsulfatase B-like [Papilio xuthus]
MFANLIFNWRCWCLIVCSISLSAAYRNPYFRRSPNILFFMVDDMGWRDLSLHGSNQILTPNLDRMAYQSVVLQSYYSEAICTPARTALLTGVYPSKLGMHGMPLYNSEDRGIPLTERLLPSYLKELGYATHLVGKWHVGMSKKEYLPTSRGYDSHYGMRGGFIDYYTYNKVETWPNGRLLFGLDLFNNDKPQEEEQRYIVDALTDRAVNVIRQHNSSSPLFLHITHNAPHAGNGGGALQPPLYSSIKHQHIANSDRRLYAEIVSHIDQSFGEVVRALSENGMLEDTIIIFASDNGAPTTGEFSNWGINLPFRGKKNTPWEGAVRVPAFVWHSSFTPTVWKGLMHITDWLPTLLAAAGGKVDKKIDGVNQWESIIRNSNSQRNEVLIAVEDSSRNIYGAYRSGDYKIVIGNVTGVSNDYYGEEFLAIKGKEPEYLPSLRSCVVSRIFDRMGIYRQNEDILAMRRATTINAQGPFTNVTLCIPTLTRGCLYNVREDPGERNDLWQRENSIATRLINRLRELWAMQLRRGPPALSAASDPANFNYIWMPWIKSNCTTVATTPDNSNKNTISYINLDDGKRTEVKNLTLSAVVNCEGTTILKNFFCILRSVF